MHADRQLSDPADIWESILYNFDVAMNETKEEEEELEKSGNGLLIISKFDFSRRPSVERVSSRGVDGDYFRVLHQKSIIQDLEMFEKTITHLYTCDFFLTLNPFSGGALIDHREDKKISQPKKYTRP